MFRFTIRDVLWLMVVVGMCVGWWVEHRVGNARHDEQIKAMERHAAEGWDAYRSLSWEHITKRPGYREWLRAQDAAEKAAQKTSPTEN
jgi:hypothetical protein